MQFYYLTSSVCVLSHFSRVRLSAILWTMACQTPLSMGFSRQEYWSGLPFPSPVHESEKWKWSCSVLSDSEHWSGLPFPPPEGNFLTQGFSLHLLRLLHWQANSLPLSHLGSPLPIIELPLNRITMYVAFGIWLLLFIVVCEIHSSFYVQW